MTCPSTPYLAFYTMLLSMSAFCAPIEESAPAPFRVAVVQFDARPGQVAHNLDAMERISREATGNRANLVMFHELSATDYLDDPGAVAESVPDGPSCRRIEALAKELGVYISFGLPEKEGDGLYIAYVFFGPQGFVEKYRKTWLFKKDEDPGFRNEWARYDPGTGPRLFELAGMKVTCLICADANSPRCIRRIAALKPELVFFPVNRAAQSFPTYPDNVKAFGAVTLVSNRVGDSQGLDCVGGATIYDPTGNVLVEANREKREEIIYWDLEPKDRVDDDNR